MKKSQVGQFASLSLAALLLALTACGPSRSDQQSFSQIDDAEPVTMNQLFGTWSTKCELVIPAENRFSVAKSRSVQIFFDRAGIYEYQEFTYSDALCRNRILYNAGEGSFAIEDEGRMISQLLGYQNVTPFNVEIATLMNRRRLCGYAAWANGAARDILTTSCAPLRRVESEAGMRETGELVINLCSPKISSTAKCEVLLFDRR